MRLILVLLYAFIVCRCNEKDINLNIQVEAQKCANALLEQNWDIVVYYTYPMIIDRMGGKNKMIQVFKNGTKEMTSQDISFQNIIIGKPIQTIKVKSIIYALVPQKITMNVPGGLLYQDSYLIGITKDAGKRWYFIDTAKFNEDNLKIVLPDLAGKIKIPKKKEPIYEKK